MSSLDEAFTNNNTCRFTPKSGWDALWTNLLKYETFCKTKKCYIWKPHCCWLLTERFVASDFRLCVMKITASPKSSQGLIPIGMVWVKRVRSSYFVCVRVLCIGWCVMGFPLDGQTGDLKRRSSWTKVLNYGY